MVEGERRQNTVEDATSNLIATAFVLYLMFLPAFALLLNLLLFLQFLCDAGLSQRLPLAPLVGLGIKGGL